MAVRRILDLVFCCGLEGEYQMREKRRTVRRYYDYALLFLALFLVGFGLIMIYSSSAYTARLKNLSSTHFLVRQGMSVLLGICAMLVVSKMDYHSYLKKIAGMKIKYVHMFYMLCIFLQIYVLLFGKRINGQKRWISLGPFSFQPSELSKIATILFVAYMITLAPRQLDRFSGFLRIGCYMLPLLGLIAVANLSTGIVIAGIIFVMCFVASRKKGYFLAVIAILLAGIGGFILLEPYRLSRVDIWLHVETHEKGFQILQGLYAIASGGIFGRGLGASMQKLGFIPESYNDMIFTIICEELGLFGAVCIILLFLLLIWRLFIIAISAPDLFGALIAVGVLAHIAVQVILNVAVVTNSIPSTGVPLPFISYGGTSVSILLIEMGIVLSVSNQIKYER